MPSKSKKQARTMTAACKSKKFRKKVNIPKKVGCDFHKADKGKYHESTIAEGKIEAAWIDPNNNVHPVGEPGAHLYWLINKFNIQLNGWEPDDKEEQKIFSYAFEYGYVRFRIFKRAIDIEGTTKALRRTYKIWKQFAKNQKIIYISFADTNKTVTLKSLKGIKKIFESIQLNELHEYIDSEGYGGWIAPDKKVHHLSDRNHTDWLKQNTEFEFPAPALDAGYVRFVTNMFPHDINFDGTQKNLQKTFRIWWPSAQKATIVNFYITDAGVSPFDKSFSFVLPKDKNELLKKFRPQAKTESIQLNELREYIGLENEYGGWITADKKIHTVDYQAHYVWMAEHYGRDDSYIPAYNDGAIRYVTQMGHLELEGYEQDVRKLFYIWWPTAFKVETVTIDTVASSTHAGTYDRYEMPRDKIHLLKKWKSDSGHPVRTLVKTVQQQNESIQLNELREYLNAENTYGGWITPDKKVYNVKYYGHSDWIREYTNDEIWNKDAALGQGYIRFQTDSFPFELSLEGKEENLQKTFRLWWPTAQQSDRLYINNTMYFIPSMKADIMKDWGPQLKIKESIQLNELREYLGNEEEYGGWITADKKVHTVGYQRHTEWVINNYDETNFMFAFNDGAVRYQIEETELNMEGTKESLIKLFRIWWPSALNVNYVTIDVIKHGANTRWDDHIDKRYSMPDDKADLLSIFGPGAKHQKIAVESIQLNELREYLGNENEYGGWITADKKVHIVSFEGHTDWVVDTYHNGSFKDYYDDIAKNNYSDYGRAFKDGAIRYIITEDRDLSIQGGGLNDVKNLFRIWWPSALNSDVVIIEVKGAHNLYNMPEEKNKLLSKYGPSSKVKEAKFGFERRDKTLKGKSGYTVSIFKHEVYGEDRNGKRIDWSETVGRVRDVKSGLYYQDAVKLSRKVDEYLARDSHEFKIPKYDHGWVDYFTKIEKDVFEEEIGFRQRGHFDSEPEAEPLAKARFKKGVKKIFGKDKKTEDGGTVGHMFRGGYDSGMKSTVTKRPKKKKSMSPVGSKKVNEKYNTNSTFLKVGKNLVELIQNKVTRRIKNKDKIFEIDVLNYRVYVDGVKVGYVDKIKDKFYVKNDDHFDYYSTLEEAVAEVMGESYYDGKGSAEFVEFNPDPFSMTI